MLFVIDENGRTEFTRSPEALALLHPHDVKRIERMTDIQFDLLSQRYYIKFLRGPFADLILRWQSAGLVRAYDLSKHWRDFVAEHSPALVHEHVNMENRPLGGNVEFDTYEGAVAIEIAFVECLREAGYSMA